MSGRRLIVYRTQQATQASASRSPVNECRPSVDPAPPKTTIAIPATEMAMPAHPRGGIRSVPRAWPISANHTGVDASTIATFATGVRDTASMKKIW